MKRYRFEVPASLMFSVTMSDETDDATALGKAREVLDGALDATSGLNVSGLLRGRLYVEDVKAPISIEDLEENV